MPFNTACPVLTNKYHVQCVHQIQRAQRECWGITKEEIRIGAALGPAVTLQYFYPEKGFLQDWESSLRTQNKMWNGFSAATLHLML
ncbi:hypothetical protein GDO86_012113 [Hymenochirus boettgeri]|uniref:Uncharacterized protein n=1 Tax=Hymenochirus boettgeri TaxID=247094 RepID=A0A8T2JE36_9PIPI|nr:hypothetical protein GDO86_012113 [Hymenochirus boettgeri]